MTLIHNYTTHAPKTTRLVQTAHPMLVLEEHAVPVRHALPQKQQVIVVDRAEVVLHNDGSLLELP